MISEQERFLAMKLAEGEEKLLQLVELFKDLKKGFINFIREHEHCSVTEAQEKLAEATTS